MFKLEGGRQLNICFSETSPSSSPGSRYPFERGIGITRVLRSRKVDHWLTLVPSLFWHECACSGILQLVFVNLSNGVNLIVTLAVRDTGSTFSFVDGEIKSSLGIDGKNLTLSMAVITGTKDMTSEKLSVRVSANNHDEIVTFHVHPNCTLGIASMIIR